MYCTSDCMSVCICDRDGKEVDLVPELISWAFYQQTTMWTLTPSCGWQPQVLHKPSPWNVWYLLVCTADPRPWSTAWCQMGCLTSGISDCYSLECIGPGLPCDLAWTELLDVAEEKQAQCLNREVLCQQTLLMMDAPQREVASLCGALPLEEQKSVRPLCWLRLSNENETVREPSAIQCLTAMLLLCFLAPGGGFSWPRARAHSELQQLWDYSGFTDLSKEPQTCWAGAKPGPQHPGSYQSGSNNHSANGFHTLLECLMILLPNILKNVENCRFFYRQNYLPIYPIPYNTMQYNPQSCSGLRTF